MTQARRAVRLLHASDLHIGDDPVGGPDPCGARPCLCPAVRVARLAREAGADAIVVCGDVFDHSRLDDATIRRVLGILTGADVPCVVVAGNHDPLDDRSVYRRMPDDSIGPGLHVIRRPDGDLVRLLDGALSVWGRSTAIHSPAYRPLRDVPARPVGGGWYVVAAHGHYLGSAAESVRVARSSPIFAEEIRRIDADYVALGHWHLATQISSRPPVWYSGWPRPAGPRGGALRVDLLPGEPAQVSLLRLPPVEG